jgi:hypothetical protein
MVDAEDEAHKLELAKGAVENIKKHFSDWGLIAQGLWIGQRQAMRAAGSNGPYGAPFKKAMKAWLVANSWTEGYDAPTRTHFIWLHDNRAEVEAWRETLTANQRDQWTHPTTVHRRFEAAHKVPAKDPTEPKRETTLEAQMRENAELWGKVKDLEGQLEERGEGSVIDDTLSALLRMEGEAIGRVIARNLIGGGRGDILEAVRAAIETELAKHGEEAKAATSKAIGTAPKDWRTALRDYLDGRVGEELVAGDLFDRFGADMPLHDATRPWLRRHEKIGTTPHATIRLFAFGQALRRLGVAFAAPLTRATRVTVGAGAEKTRSRTKAADADEGGFAPGVVEHLKAENKPAKRKASTKATVTS